MSGTDRLPRTLFFLLSKTHADFAPILLVLTYRTPMKKFAQAYDIATQVVMLSSSAVSGHVTGQVVMVEGGMEGRVLNRREDVV